MRTFWYWLYDDDYHFFDLARSFIFDLAGHDRQELRAYVLVCSIQLI